LQLRKRKAPLLVVLPDLSTKRIAIDWTQPVKKIIHEIGDRLSLASLADSYGLRLKPLEASTFQSGTSWLENDLLLDQQKVGKGDCVYLYKRYFDLFSPVTETTAPDEHLCFSQLSNCFLQGFYDEVLNQNLEIELSACLTTISKGRTETKPPAQFFEDLSSQILSPKWRKKTKPEFFDRIALTYISLCQQTWSADTASLKRHFLRCVSKVASIGTLTFPADGVRLGDGTVFESSTVQVSCLSVALLSCRSGSDKAASMQDKPTMTIPLDTVLRSSVIQTTATFSFMSTSGSLVSAAVNTPHAVALSETINGFAFVGTLRKRSDSPISAPRREPLINVVFRSGTMRRSGMKGSSSFGSPSSSISEEPKSFSFTEATMDETLEQSRDKLSHAEKKLHRLSTSGEVLSSKRASVSATLRRKGLVQLLAGDTIASAVSGVSAISTGATSLARTLTSNITSSGQDSSRLLQAVSKWVSAVCNVARNITSASPAPHGIQVIASMAGELISMCSQFLSIVYDMSLDTTRKELLRNEIVIAENSLTTACSALQLALQGRLCEDISATSLLICVKDISASAEEMFALGDTIVSVIKDIHTSPVAHQVQKARSMFQWHLKTASVCCKVIFGSDKIVLTELRAAVAALRATATQLLNRTAECITESSESQSFVDHLSAMRWSWSCVNQSCQLYDNLIQLGAKGADSPSSTYVAHVFTDLMSAADRGAQSDPLALAELVQSSGSSLVRLFNQGSSMLVSDLTSDIARLKDCLASFSSAASPTANATAFFESFLWVFEAILSVLRSVFLADSIQSPKDQIDARLLLLNLTFLRSLLRLCASSKFDSVDVTIVKKVCDEFEVLLATLVPSIGAHLLSGSKDSAPLAWESQLQSFHVILHVDMPRFGCFRPILETLSGMLGSSRSARSTSSRESRSSRSTVSMEFNGSAPAHLPRLIFMKDIGRSGSSLSSLSPRSKTIKRINLASISSKVTLSTKEAFALTSGEGDVEAINETAFLDALQHLIVFGQPPAYLSTPICTTYHIQI
jgi:hypothetical protein